MPLSICLENDYIIHVYVAELHLAQHRVSGMKYSNLWPLLATKAKTDKPIFKGLSLLNSFVFVY